MSFAYATEPPTKGKVVLKTSLGDVEIEFWAKEAPKAVRNFIQLCMEGYYDNTIFHRVVKGFIVQGGDPTGTGLGGESAYGKPFADEFHSRLRFMRRGLLAMANVGKNTNTSQFFFTLDATEELNKKNTIFGKVVGDTVFNVLAMGELETDNYDRPLSPPKIISVEILANPFDDIVPRTTPEERAEKAAREIEERERESKAKVKKGKKNLSLLSFGDEPEDETPSFRIKSSHDVLRDERLSKAAITIDESKPRKKAEAKQEKDTAEYKAEEERKAKRKAEELENPSAAKKATVESQIEKLQQEIRKMDASKRAAAAERDKPSASLVDQFRQQYVGKAIIGRRAKKTEDTLIEELSAFKTKIFRSEPAEEEIAPAYVCDLHGIEECKSCKDTFGEEKPVNDSGWLAHKLKFVKDSANVYEPSVDDYVYFGFDEAIKDFKKYRDDLLRLAMGATSEESPSPHQTRNKTEKITGKARKKERETPTPPMDDPNTIHVDSHPVDTGFSAQPGRSFAEVELQEKGEKIVTCPICNSSVRYKDLDRHIGQNCKTAIVEAKPAFGSLQSSSSNSLDSGKIDTRRAAVHYDGMKETQLRKLLKDEKLRTDGDKAMMKRRHREWMVRLQANGDSYEPRSLDELRTEMLEWEEATAKSQILAAHPFHNGSHEEDPTTSKALNNHAVKYKRTFDDMVEELRERKKKKLSKPLEAQEGNIQNEPPAASGGNEHISSPQLLH
ncbi:Peptidyl-prolyl isomerase cwc27 [Dinochytrium kinnereticum]|nr:Peptidyl-prolyl isomerase cwc27 [Dinochytrium kinnereticum]